MSSDVVHLILAAFFASGFPMASDDIHHQGCIEPMRILKKVWQE